MNRTATQQRAASAGWISGWVIALALLMLLVGAFLSLPLADMNVPFWLAPIQANMQAAARQAGPFLLVLVNAAAATLAYVIAKIYSPIAANPLLLAMGTGVGFQALIRTRFVLARDFSGQGENKEVSVNLGWLYDQFQALCKTQIDLELMNNRRSAVSRLVQRYPTVQELHGLAAYTIEARATLTPTEEAERQATLETLASGQAPTDIARAKIALFILETGGQAFVEFLLQQLEAAPPPPATETPAPPPAAKAAKADSVVRQLAEQYSLKDLVKLANELTSDAALRDWVKKAAETAPGVSEAQQKATIGYRLVREAGLEAVQGKIAGTPPAMG